MHLFDGTTCERRRETEEEEDSFGMYVLMSKKSDQS